MARRVDTDAYVAAMGDWNDLDPAIFAPRDGTTYEPMSERLGAALLVAATLEAGDAGLSFDHLAAIIEDVRECIAQLSILRAVLLGGCGPSWDDATGTMMLRLVDSPEECRKRRDLIAAVLAIDEADLRDGSSGQETGE